MMSAPVVNLPANFPAVLDDERQSAVAEKLAGAQLATLALRDIATLGADAEQALHRTLDGFLGRIEASESPRLFKLVEQLREAVEKEDLPAVAARILDAKPSLGERLLGFFNRKALRIAAARAYEEACRLAAGKSRKLSETVAAMERELQVEQQKLTEEIRVLEALKDSYRERFVDFAEVAAFMLGLLDKARGEAAALTAGNTDPQLAAETQDKLQALESRALALEGTLSRLPSDQLVIRQLQNAGIATLQETATTAASRFASIKMTLLTIHGARVAQDVQRLAQQGAELDKNLAGVREMLMRDVVTRAADAPGDNRLAQARQLQGIVAETQALQQLVEASRQRNREKFDEARRLFAEARQQMTGLGRTLAPAKPLSV